MIISLLVILRSLQIIIRVDGNSKIGIGHIYRMLNLAFILKKQRHKITFLTKTRFAMKILSKFFRCFSLDSNSLLQTKKIIHLLNPDVILIDKHTENSTMIKIFQKYCKHVIGIDYVGKNKNLISTGINILYPKSGINTASSSSDLKYAILNKSFTTIKPIKIKKNATSILVLQGGSDDHCFTPKIIDSLNCLTDNFKMTVVIGPAFKCWSKLTQILQNNKKCLKLIRNVNNMTKLMVKHDIAITAGGMTLLELCRLGVPSIVICTSKLENETANLLQKKGFGVNLGFDTKLSKTKIISTTKQLLLNYETRKNMNKIGKKLIDGEGADRVGLLITKLGTR